MLLLTIYYHNYRCELSACGVYLFLIRYPESSLTTEGSVVKM